MKGAIFRVEYLCIGTRDELESMKRPIDYGERQGAYNSLHPFFQTAVDNTVNDLTEGGEYEGYNYEQIMKWGKESHSSANQNRVIGQIAKYNLKYVFSGYLGYNKNEFMEIFNKRLDTFRKSTKGTKPDSELGMTLRLICDYFLVSPDLLTRGQGPIYFIEDKYFESISDEFIRSITRETFSTKTVFEEYAKSLGIPEDEVIKTGYAIIPKKGNYLLLGANKRYRHMKVAVDNLIDQLLWVQKHKLMLGGLAE